MANGVPGACPGCGQEFIGSVSMTHRDKAQPTVGDISFCTRCGCIGIFEEDLEVRVMGLEEGMKLPDEVQASLAHAIMKFKSLTEEGLDVFDPPDRTYLN